MGRSHADLKSTNVRCNRSRQRSRPFRLRTRSCGRRTQRCVRALGSWRRSSVRIRPTPRSRRPAIRRGRSPSRTAAEAGRASVVEADSLVTRARPGSCCRQSKSTSLYRASRRGNVIAADGSVVMTRTRNGFRIWSYPRSRPWSLNTSFSRECASGAVACIWGNCLRECLLVCWGRVRWRWWRCCRASTT